MGEILSTTLMGTKHINPINLTPISGGVYKICLLGNPSVGKTTLAHFLVEGHFRSDFKSTMGADILKKTLVLGSEKDRSEKITINIWDMGGQSAFDVLRKRFYKGANAAVIVFDGTSKKTLEAIPDWVNDFLGICQGSPVLILGNKNDLDWCVSSQEIDEKLETLPCEFEYIATSAKTGRNVDAAFMRIVNILRERDKKKYLGTYDSYSNRTDHFLKKDW